MKILYVTTISNTVNAFLIPHIRMLIKEGHQVDLAFNVVGEVDSELIDLGCKVHKLSFVRSPLRKENFTAFKKLKQLIQDEQYDMVHTHTPIASACVRLACKNFDNVKVIYTAHGFHFYKGAPLKNYLIYYTLEKSLARFTDAIITINQEDYMMAKEFKLKEENSVYNTNGVGINLNRFSPASKSEKINLRKQYGYKSDDFILFYAAELNWNKHQDLLITAVSLLKEKIPNIRLILAGEGNFREKYEGEVKKLGIQEHVSFLGTRNDVHLLLKMSDIAVASSRREGLPVNIMEAMATGLPLVVTDCRGHRDLVKDNKNGFIVGIDDSLEFSNAIEELYSSADLRKRFSNKNIERSKIYSIDNVMKEIEVIYSCYM